MLLPAVEQDWDDLQVYPSRRHQSQSPVSRPGCLGDLVSVVWGGVELTVVGWAKRNTGGLETVLERRAVGRAGTVAIVGVVLVFPLVGVLVLVRERALGLERVPELEREPVLERVPMPERAPVLGRVPWLERVPVLGQINRCWRKPARCSNPTNAG